jgi:hypothetical protein
MLWVLSHVGADLRRLTCRVSGSCHTPRPRSPAGALDGWIRERAKGEPVGVNDMDSKAFDGVLQISTCIDRAELPSSYAQRGRTLTTLSLADVASMAGALRDKLASAGLGQGEGIAPLRSRWTIFRRKPC